MEATKKMNPTLAPDIKKTNYHKVFLVHDRDHWQACNHHFDAFTDLALVIDFGLYKELSATGVSVHYLEGFLHPDYLQQLNFELHHFLHHWSQDVNGTTVLSYKGHALGKAFLLNLLSDITYHSHFIIFFLHLHLFTYDQLFVALQDDLLAILDATGMAYTRLPVRVSGKHPTYTFPIRKWMAEAMNPQSWQMTMKQAVAKGFDYFFFWYDRIMPAKKRVFVQEYYSTFQIIEQLRRLPGVQIVTTNYTGLKKVWQERRILYRRFASSKKAARDILARFRTTSILPWQVLGFSMDAYLHPLVVRMLEKELEQACNAVESIERFFRHNKPLLMVPISDLWMHNSLLIAYCKQQKIPVYFIANGLLSLKFWKEGQTADYINCFGTAAQKDFFEDDPRTLCLGDTRMDAYVRMGKKPINRTNPVIVIGTAAFNLLDFNSFLGVEFEFLDGILSVLSSLQQAGKQFQLQLKVRANGYVHLYESFIQEYYPGLNIRIFQHEPFTQVISQADLYLSFYSQTLIEAAALGIPVIYYKNDRQHMLPPFDGTGELVTVRTAKELEAQVSAFYNGDPSLNAFCRREVLERYVGPLDGQNTGRNIAFIKTLARL